MRIGLIIVMRHGTPGGFGRTMVAGDQNQIIPVEFKGEGE
jgi:hypothetical protein